LASSGNETALRIRPLENLGTCGRDQRSVNIVEDDDAINVDRHREQRKKSAGIDRLNVEDGMLLADIRRGLSESLILA
jgi:hypothetical protein